MFAALNIAYEEPERRSLLRFYLSAFTFAILGIFSGVLMLLAIVYVPILFAYAGYSHTFELVVRMARWPLLALIVLILLALLYRYGPCRRSAQWRWVTVGSVFATAAVARRFGGLLLLRVALRQLRPHLRLARRGDRAAVLALPLVLHRAARRRDQRGARIADGQGHHARRAEADGRARRFRRRPRGGGADGTKRPVSAVAADPEKAKPHAT